MRESQLPAITRNLLCIATRAAVKVAEIKAKPYIVSGILIASQLGILPKQKIKVTKLTRCSSCGKHKRGNFLVIRIPWTAGEIWLCSSCKQRESKKIKKWIEKKIRR